MSPKRCTAFNEYVNVYFAFARKSPETEQSFTKRDRFDELYRDMINLPQKERRANLVTSTFPIAN